MRSSAGSGIVLILFLVAFGLAPFSPSTRAQTTRGYPDSVHAYRSFDPDAVGRLRALTADVIEDAVSEATGGKPQTWQWADVRGAAMLHTEAWYLGPPC